MSRRMEWKDSNTSFGDIAAAMAVQSRSNEEMLARFDAYQKEHVAQQMLNADKERAFNTGQMLSDNAAGKDVNMDQPYDSLAYYQDAEKFKNDNRNYTLDETRANAMASHYKHLDVMNNMSDTAKAADARKTAMISAALRGTGGKKSGSSRYGSSKKGGGATTATDVLLNKAKAMGTEPYSGWFGLGGMDEEQMSKAGAMIETAFPGDIRSQKIIANQISGPDNSMVNSWNVASDAKVKVAIQNRKKQLIAERNNDYKMQGILQQRTMDELTGR